MGLIEKARELAKHTETIACTPHWGVDDQETLEGLIIEIAELQAQLAKAQLVLDAAYNWERKYGHIPLNDPVFHPEDTAIIKTVRQWREE